MSTKRYDVGVIGGGLAGLTCAHQLTSQGLGTIVVEAAHRLGGRLKTIEWKGRRIELGAKAVPQSAGELLGVIEGLGLIGELHPVRGGSGAALHGPLGTVRCTGKDILGEHLSRCDRAQSALYLLRALDSRRRPVREEELHARSFAEDTRAHCAPSAEAGFFAPLSCALAFSRCDELSALAAHRCLSLLLAPQLELSDGFESLVDALSSALGRETNVATDTTVERLEERRVGYTIHCVDPQRHARVFQVDRLVCALPISTTARLFAPLGLRVATVPYRCVRQELVHGELAVEYTDCLVNLMVDEFAPRGVQILRIDEKLFAVLWADECDFSELASRLFRRGFEAAGLSGRRVPYVPVVAPGSTIPAEKTSRDDLFLCGDFDLMQGLESCALTARRAAAGVLESLGSGPTMPPPSGKESRE